MGLGEGKNEREDLGEYEYLKSTASHLPEVPERGENEAFIFGHSYSM